MEKQDVSKQKKKGGKKKIIIVIIIILVILIGVVLWFLLHEPKRNVVVNEDNVDKIISEMEESEYTPPGRYEVKMNSTWNFPDGSSPSDNAYVENVVNNTNDVYFDVELADSGEVILKSPVIPIGSHMDNITLDKDLAAGTYDCVLIYHLVDEDQNTISTLRMAITINIAS